MLKAEHKLGILVSEQPLDLDKIKSTEGYVFNEGYHMLPFPEQGFILQFQESTKTIYIYEPINDLQNISLVHNLKLVLQRYGKVKWFWEYILISLHFNDDITVMENVFYPIVPFIVSLNDENADYKGSQLTLNYAHPYDKEATLVVRVAQPIPTAVVLEINMLKKFHNYNNVIDIVSEGNKLTEYLKEVCSNMFSLFANQGEVEKTATADK